MTNIRTPLLGLLLATATAFAGSAIARAEDQITLGAIVPSSGPFAEWGRSNTTTLNLLEKQVNEAGGVAGKKLKIVIYDDGAKPAEAANALRKLAGDDKVLAVAGPLTSSACEVTFPVANEMKIVSTSQASSKPGVAKANRPWAFRNTVDEGILAKVSVPYFKKTFDVKTVAVIYDAKDAVSTAIATKIMPKVFAVSRHQGAQRERSDLVQYRRVGRQRPGDQAQGAQSGRRRDRRRLQPGDHGSPRDEAPGLGEAGDRRHAADLVGDSSRPRRKSRSSPRQPSTPR